MLVFRVLRTRCQAGNRDIDLYIELDLFTQVSDDFEMLLVCMVRFHPARVPRLLDDPASGKRNIQTQTLETLSRWPGTLESSFRRPITYNFES